MFDKVIFKAKRASKNTKNNNSIRKNMNSVRLSQRK